MSLTIAAVKAIAFGSHERYGKLDRDAARELWLDIERERAENTLTARAASAWHRLAAWSDRTFGTPEQRGPLGALAHLKREADEAAAEPSDVIEFADCQILLWDAARRAGHTLDELLSAVEAKQTRNEGRTWAPPDADGVRVHVREVGE